uniref:Uncharacterized protein n=1 Tax=Lygus hesperus TaxID=30085 RepID=A0A146KUB4_LYGHE
MLEIGRSALGRLQTSLCGYHFNLETGTSYFILSASDFFSNFAECVSSSLHPDREITTMNYLCSYFMVSSPLYSARRLDVPALGSSVPRNTEDEDKTRREWQIIFEKSVFSIRSD